MSLVYSHFNCSVLTTTVLRLTTQIEQCTKNADNLNHSCLHSSCFALLFDIVVVFNLHFALGTFFQFERRHYELIVHEAPDTKSSCRFQPCRQVEYGNYHYDVHLVVINVLP